MQATCQDLCLLGRLPQQDPKLVRRDLTRMTCPQLPVYEHQKLGHTGEGKPLHEVWRLLDVHRVE